MDREVGQKIFRVGTGIEPRDEKISENHGPTRPFSIARAILYGPYSMIYIYRMIYTYMLYIYYMLCIYIYL